MAASQERPAVIEMRHIVKSFGAVQALRGVDLVLKHNQVLGLVGDNAAGKSTLMKVLSGAYVPDQGEILIDGQRRPTPARWKPAIWGSRWSTRTSRSANNLDVAANVFLGP